MTPNRQQKLQASPAPKHTPGPWEVTERMDGYKNIYWGVKIVASQVRPKDAALIAAAPELLEALKRVVAVADRETDEFDMAHAAIAKAEGRNKANNNKE